MIGWVRLSCWLVCLFVCGVIIGTQGSSRKPYVACGLQLIGLEVLYGEGVRPYTKRYLHLGETTSNCLGAIHH